jgi:hypothetical protein
MRVLLLQTFQYPSGDGEGNRARVFQLRAGAAIDAGAFSERVVASSPCREWAGGIGDGLCYRKSGSALSNSSQNVLERLKINVIRSNDYRIPAFFKARVKTAQ